MNPTMCEFFEQRNGMWFCRSPKARQKRLICPPAKQCKGDVSICPFGRDVSELTWVCPECGISSSISNDTMYITDTVRMDHDRLSPNCPLPTLQLEFYYA